MNYMNLASEYEVPDRRSYQPHFPRPPARGACVTALCRVRRGGMV